MLELIQSKSHSLYLLYLLAFSAITLWGQAPPDVASTLAWGAAGGLGVLIGGQKAVDAITARGPKSQPPAPGTITVTP